MQPHIKSNELSLHTANKNTEVFCYRCGGRDYHKSGRNRNGNQSYFCTICRRQFVEKFDQEYKRTHLELGDDVWDASEIGVKRNGSIGETKLVFSYIKQDWLKDATKKFVKYQATSKSFSVIQHFIGTLNRFSSFLENCYPITDFETINREVIIEFIYRLNREGLKADTKNKILGNLNLFFETGNINSWFKVPAYLIRREDKAKSSVKRLPKYIPEEVMQQLNQHLDVLPESVIRMVLVLQETGLRVGELLQLPINCLKHNAGGDPFIQHMNWKMSKEDTKPISPELAKVIQEQQQYIRLYLGEKFEYLFCARKTGRCRDKNPFRPQPRIMHDSSFINFLKKLADDFDIKDSSGKRWNFQAHQFRHTVATRMINLGVPVHIIQRYLGHESPAMTMVYAHIHDETLRKEVEKYHESRVVNFQGETAELEETVLSSNDDLEWFKQSVQARALEHGYCARPKVLGDCDIPGFDGCYNCPHWRTNKHFLPILKDTLERTNQVLDKAQNYAWQL